MVGTSFINGQCWGKDNLPIYDKIIDVFATVKVQHSNPDRSNLIGGCLMGYFSTFALKYGLGVLIPYCPEIDGVDPLKGIDERTDAYKKAVRENLIIMSFNPKHEVHPPFHVSLKEIKDITCIEPGQTYLPNFKNPTEVASLDEVLIKQIKPAKEYLKEMKFKPLNWKQYLIYAVNAAIKENLANYNSARIQSQIQYEYYVPIGLPPDQLNNCPVMALQSA